MKGGTISGSNLAAAGAWPTADAYASYGGATQLWGLTWLPSDITATNFGAALAARVQNGTAAVDHMRIIVYYYSTLPVELLYFRAWAEGAQVALQWATATESNSERFEVHRSLDGIHYAPITSLPAAGHANTLLEYRAWDDLPVPGALYYKLKQVDLDGTSDESDVVVVTYQSEQAPYPNPTSVPLFLPSARSEQAHVTVLNKAMQVVLEAPLSAEDPIVNLERLPEGTYTILVHQGSETTVHRAVKQSIER